MTAAQVVPVVLGVALDRDATGLALVDTTGQLRQLPTSPRSPFTVRHSTAQRRRTRRDGLRDTVAGLNPQPILAVISTGKAKGSSELLSDVLDVLDGYGVPTVIVPRAEVIRFATGSSRQGVVSLLAPLVHCWPDQHPWPLGEVGHGGPVAPIAACLGVAALGGVQPIPSSPGRDRAIASVTWPSPLPLIDHR